MPALGEARVAPAPWLATLSNVLGVEDMAKTCGVNTNQTRDGVAQMVKSCGMNTYLALD